MQDSQALGALLWPLRLALVTLVLYGIFWLVSVAAQVLIAYRSAPNDPEAQVASLELLLSQDLEYASRLHPMIFEPIRLSSQIGDVIKEYTLDTAMYALRSVMNLPADVKKLAPHPDVHQQADLGGSFMRDRFLPEHRQQVALAITANYIFAVRSVLFLCATPLALLAYLIATVDGLSARAIRRACAGRESASLYHRAKIAQLWVIGGSFIGYVCLPHSLNPCLLLVPMVLASAYLVRLQGKYYKKYL
jgi:Domain of unknown function (DUF4400)